MSQYKTSKKWIYSCLLIFIVFGSYQNYLSQTKRPSFMVEESKRPDFVNLVDYFKTKPKTNVYCGLFYQALPLLTEVKCSWHHLLMTYPLSNEELLRESLTQMRLSGLSDDQVERTISLDASPDRSLGVWSFGVQPEWVNGMADVDIYSIKNLHENVIPKWMQIYREFSFDDAIAQLESVDELVLPLDSGALIEGLHLVKAFTAYGVYSAK